MDRRTRKWCEKNDFPVEWYGAVWDIMGLPFVAAQYKGRWRGAIHTYDPFTGALGTKRCATGDTFTGLIEAREVAGNELGGTRFG